MKIIWLWILICFFSFKAWPGGESNGGVGVTFGSRVGLLDLVEGKVKRGTIPSNFELPLYDTEFLPEFVKSLRWVPLNLTNVKMVELSQLNPEFAQLLLQNWQEMQWQLVRHKLPRTDDVYEKHKIKIPRTRLAQMAVRQGTLVRIDDELLWNTWKEHQVALIFHEGISTMYYSALAHCQLVDPTTYPIREIVALLFSPAEESRDLVLKQKTDAILRRNCPKT